MGEDFKEYVRGIKFKYDQIKSIKCPAFGNELILFNKYGFNHIIWKKNERRSVAQQKRRFSLIVYAMNIIKSSTAFNTYRIVERPINNNKSVSIAHFWSLVGQIDNRKIIVIIRKTNNGPKHFLSVMNKEGKK